MTDAEAICKAVTRKNMRFVPVKNVEQQAILSVHRARQGFVKARTAQANQIRGPLAEYGVAIPVGISHVTKDVPKIVEDAGQDLPGSFQQLIVRLVGHFKELDQQVDELEGQIKQWHRENEASCKLAEIPGVGPHGQCRGRLGWRWQDVQDVQEWPAIGGMAGPGPATAFDRWQVDLLGHKQAWRHLPAYLAHSRCSISRARRAGQQKCPDCVGTAGQRPQVPVWLCCRWCGRIV